MTRGELEAMDWSDFFSLYEEIHEAREKVADAMERSSKGKGMSMSSD